MTNRININPLLDEIIKESGLTQEEIAKDLGYDRAYLSQARKEGTKKLQDKLVAYLENVRKSKETNGAKKSPTLEDETFKDKYIALLEQRVKELEARSTPPPSIGTDIAGHLSKIQNETRELLILVLESQRYLLKQQAASPKKYLEALRTIQRTALDSLEKDLQWGTDEGTNDN